MRASRYVLVLLCSALVCAPCAYLGTWAAKVAGCRTMDRPGAFLAYCSTPSYGSYEHEAYYFGLEPGLVDSVRRARVLFLGNSRLQVAFSTAAVTRFFQGRSVEYHLLGFGYGESSLFPRRVLDRIRPHPDLIVVNADPFFADTLSLPGYDIARKPWASRIDGWNKRLFGWGHLLLCRFPGGCPQTVGATYRDRDTGQWIWKDVLVPAGTVAGPIVANAGNWPESALPTWQHVANAFLAEAFPGRPCIILTGVPTPVVDAEGMTAALGGLIGLPVVLPSLDGLTTSDGSHLSADSAERWSDAFLTLAAPLIDACLAGSRGSGQHGSGVGSDTPLPVPVPGTPGVLPRPQRQ